MNLMQISNSRRSVTIATALIGVLSLAIGAHAALNQRTTVIPDVVSVEQSVEIPAKASRIALVIGNGHYPDANTPLAQPINDARGLTTSLRHDGFDGFFSMEPHLAEATATGGFSGPDRFAEATDAFTALLRERGIGYR